MGENREKERNMKGGDRQIADDACDGPSTNLTMNIVGTRDMRKGVYSNFVLVKSTEHESFLDFCLNDNDQNEDGSTDVIVVSRVIMSNESLKKLRDTLDRHVAEHLDRLGIGGEDDKAED